MTVKPAAHVLDLLAYFAERQQPASLAEVAQAMGWPRSSAFKLLGTLSARGFLYEPLARGGYYPTPLWSTLIGRIDGADPLPQHLHRLLQALVDLTGETAVIAAASGLHAVFVDAIESPHAVRYAARTGKLVPLHVTATGRALLSLMSATERASVLRRAVYERHTSSTLMDAAAVAQEITRSQARGWFEGHAEFTPHLGGVALPLELPQRRLAVLVAGPVFRLQSSFPALAQQIRQTIETFVPEARLGG